MNVLFSDKVSPQFIAKVKSISYNLGIDPSWLMLVMGYETEFTFSPSISNGIGATGLIQFLPSTAASLGTTTTALANMDSVSQLDYVYQYLKPYKGKMTDFYSVYQAIFYPASLGQLDTYVFPDNVVAENPSFFKTGNTLADFKKGLDTIVYEHVPTTYYDTFFKKKILFCRSIKSKLLSEPEFCYS